jgi:hypothetical protein
VKRRFPGQKKKGGLVAASRPPTPRLLSVAYTLFFCSYTMTSIINAAIKFVKDVKFAVLHPPKITPEYKTGHIELEEMFDKSHYNVWKPNGQLFSPQEV